MLKKDADYVDDLALLENALNEAESLLNSLNHTAGSIGPHMNVNKTEDMCCKWEKPSPF